jgi:heme/copper-type cytochrome/quinol oxidase subunit 2
MTDREAYKAFKSGKITIMVFPIFLTVIGIGFAFLIQYVGNTDMYNKQIKELSRLTQD